MGPVASVVVSCAETVRETRRLCARGRVAVAGPTGSGLSTVARGIAARAESDRAELLFITPSVAWQSQPWAALAQADPSWAKAAHLDLGADPTGAVAIGAAAARVATAALVVIDDADLLDAHTAAVLARTSTPVAAVVNTERPWSSAVRELVAACARLEAPLADEGQVRAAADAAWGAPPDQWSTHRLVCATGGRPGHVRRLLEALAPHIQTEAQRARLPARIGTWGDLPAWAAQRAQEHGEPAARALRLVAVHPELRPEDVAAVVGAAATDQLLTAGVLKREGGSGPGLAIADPLLRTVLAEAVAPAFAVDDARALLATARQSTPSWALARWQVTIGESPDPDGLARALAGALDSGDIATANSLGAMAASLGTPTLLNLRSEQLAATGRVADALEVAELAARSNSPRASGRGRLVGADLLFFRVGDPIAALDLLGVNAPVDSDSADEVRALARLIATVTGRTPSTIAVAPAETPPTRRPTPPYAALLEDLGTILAGRSRPETPPLSLAASAPPLLRPRAHVNSVLHAIASGDVARAADAAACALTEALETDRPGAVGLALAMRADVASLAGKLQEAAETLDEALWLLDQDDESGVRDVARAARAGVAAEAGHLAQAQELLLGIDPGADARVDLRASVARLRIVAARDSHAAEREAMAAVDLGVARGNVLWGALAGLHALRAGVRGSLPNVLAAAVEGGTGELFPAIGALAQGQAEANARRVADAGDRFAACGLARVAAEAWLSAADLDDAAERATRWRTRAAAALATLGPPAIAAATVPLTARERQVAQLATGGATSAQIADALSISVRTVDNHLRAVYVKTGVEGRKGLTSVVIA